MIHILGETEQGSVRFHHATQNGAQLKFMDCLFLEFPISYSQTSVEYGQETRESNAMDKGQDAIALYLQIIKWFEFSKSIWSICRSILVTYF